MVVIELLRWGAMFVIWMTVWRLVQAKLVADDSAIGKAMAFIG
jgi:hypothetical protein